MRSLVPSPSAKGWPDTTARILRPDERRRGAARVRQERRELVAAVAVDALSPAHHPAHARREAREQRVAREVAVGVVHLLEAVQIDHRDAGRAAARARTRPPGGDPS